MMSEMVLLIGTLVCLFVCSLPSFSPSTVMNAIFHISSILITVSAVFPPPIFSRLFLLCRLFQNNAIHNQITRLLIHRVKYIAGYPESSAEIINSTVPSLLTDIDLYGDGPVRAMEVRRLS